MNDILAMISYFIIVFITNVGLYLLKKEFTNGYIGGLQFAIVMSAYVIIELMLIMIFALYFKNVLNILLL